VTLLSKLRYLWQWGSNRPVWRMPKHAQILVFDAEMAELLEPFLKSTDHHVLHQRGRGLNTAILLKSLRHGLSLEAYVRTYVLAVRPELVISLLDNDPALYRVKQYLPTARVVAIQNGWRGFAYEMFGQGYTAADRLACDEILVFGPAIGKKFEQIISGRTVTIGSFKNNLVPVRHDPDSKTVALISTLRSKVDLNNPVQVAEGHRVVLYSEIFERRLRLAEYCHAFCRREGYHLRILGKDPEIGREFTMYAERLGEPGASWSFTPRSTLLANYPELDRARAVISSGSSLGYEALGRGCRVAFFMIDFEVLHEVGANFGWPLDLPDSGHFWSNRLDEAEVESILTHVVQSSDEIWRASSESIASQLVSYEEGNTTLREIIDSI
jgi:surface carbohydrate biosynthesis protein